MSSLLEKIRKAREVGVEAGGHQFTIRRPTDEDAMRMSGDGMDMLAIVKAHTIGWDLTELDLIPGGSGVAVPFDADLFGEWVADNPDVWQPLGMAILDAYKAHAEKREQSAKN